MSIQIERFEQINFIGWMEKNYPDVLFTASTSAIKLPMFVAALMKKLGYRAGTPDILIFEPRGQYHGLFIEMKRPKTAYGAKGKISDSQIIFIGELLKRGYSVAVCYGFEEAKTALENYLSFKGR